MQSFVFMLKLTQLYALINIAHRSIIYILTCKVPAGLISHFNAS